MKREWLRCPLCKSKTRVVIQSNTVLKNFLLFCPKCKQETMIDLDNEKITVKEPDAKTQSQYPY